MDEIGRDFEKWYEIFPRHREKIEAERAYRRVRQRGATKEQLEVGAMQYAKERVGQDPKYTKYPATWLNRGCWTDELDEQPNSFDAAAFQKAWDIRAQEKPSDDVRCPPRKDH